MKPQRKLLFLTIFSLFISSCDLQETLNDVFVSDVDVPDQFSIDIPDAISSNTGNLTGRGTGDGDGIIEGQEIYESLRYFIHIGEESADIIESTLAAAAIAENGTFLRTVTINGDDGREKRLNLEDEVTRNGITYAHELTLVDEETNQQALQMLWNTNPVEGIAILRPFYIDQIENANIENAFIRIDYSESSAVYDETMTVSISGLETIENGDVDNMKMFVGKSGDMVEVMGNSNHPNLIIFDDSFTEGRNYAFIGKSDQAANLGVVKLALPPSSIAVEEVLETYSVYSVLDDEIQSVTNLDESTIEGILVEADAPAYFNENGFITSGVNNKPNGFSDALTNLNGMNPFIPMEVRDLNIGFIQ